MSYQPLVTVPQYAKTVTGTNYDGAVLKAYKAGTVTPLAMATDYTGVTTVTDALLNSAGYPTTSGNVFIPYFSESYKLCIYPDQASADADSGEIWSVDNIQVTNDWVKGADIASASQLPVNIIGNIFDVTGTTGIATFEDRGGNDTIILQFDSALTITNSASLVLPGGQNITTRAGDIGIFTQESTSVWRCVSWMGLSAKDIQSQRHTYASDTGAVNAYAAATVPAYTAVAAGYRVTLLIANANTKSSTLNVNAIAATAIKLKDGNDVYPGAIQATLHTFDHNGTYWILQDPFPPITNFYSGLGLSINGTDAVNDIDFAAGSCNNSTGAQRLVLETGLTKQLDVAFAAGTNAGGLFSGTKAASTVYHMFLIKKDSDGTIDAGFDTSVSAANIPVGYTAFQYLGYGWTDGSSAWQGLVAARNDGKAHALEAAIALSGTATNIPYIPTWVRRIEVSVVGASINGSTDDLRFQFGDSTGYYTTGYVSRRSYMAAGSAGSSSVTDGIWAGAGSLSSVDNTQAVFELNDPSTNSWSAKTQNGAEGNNSTYIGTGYRALTNALDRFRIKTTSGTDSFDAGTMMVVMR